MLSSLLAPLHAALPAAPAPIPQPRVYDMGPSLPVSAWRAFLDALGRNPGLRPLPDEPEA